jgi:uncharacterized membrane protein HdeD (DUF308 family)
MSVDSTAQEESLHAGRVIRSNWIYFVILGIALMGAGAMAIVLPAVSAMAANRVLGLVLVMSGILPIFQSTKMLHWTGFAWNLALGILLLIGGTLIYLDPFKGVVTITLLIAVVIVAYGVTQVAFALKIRRQSGWLWFLISGCIALIVSALLVMKLPYNQSFTPATLAGVSLLSAGWAYVAVAVASRRAV